MSWIARRRKRDAQVSEIHERVSALGANLNNVQRRLDAIDQLIRDLHTDSWNANALRSEAVQVEIRRNSDRLHQLISQNHSDMWEADEKRALSLADVVLISMVPQIDAIKRDLTALIGEKAVEVFREVSHNG